MEEQARIKVVGVGDAGNHIVNRMIEEKVQNVTFVQINTDVQNLKVSKTNNTLQIGKETTQGLGTGTDVMVGERAAIENKEEIKKVLGKTDMLFLTAGMGGGTGTGAIPIIARIAKDLGILTIGIVTKPFSFEGKKRTLRAEQGIEELRRVVDALIIIPNDNLLEIAGNKTTIKDAFKMVDNVLKTGIRSITDLITTVGDINIDYADVKAIMQYKGGAYMGIGIADGKDAISDAVTQAIENKLTEIKIDNAKGVIVTIIGDKNLGLKEINDSISLINDRIDPDANIIFGTTVDKSLKDAVKATIIATGIE